MLLFNYPEASRTHGEKKALNTKCALHSSLQLLFIIYFHCAKYVTSYAGDVQ
jgi:hypothetical protein